MYELLIEINFTESESAEIAVLLKSSRRTYKKNEIIIRFTKETDELGIIKSGRAYLISINGDGQKAIIDCFERGDSFCGENYPADGLNACYIIAKSSCTVEFVSYSRLRSRAGELKSAGKLFDFLLGRSVRRNFIHTEILSQRSIRLKLLCYFEYLKGRQKSTQITLPMTYSDLADYIAADRSALMREVKNLSSEGVITADGKRITLNGAAGKNQQ